MNTPAPGDKFGKLTIITEVERHLGRRAFLFLCDCGNQCVRVLHDVQKKGRENPSCGCSRKGVNAIETQIGEKFGRLTAMAELPKRIKNGHSMRVFLWKCDCGNTKSILLNKVRSGVTKSCGCLQSESNIRTKTTHGLKHTSEYKAWSNIKDRCLNPNCHAYHDYGARGITMCDEWKNSVETFYNDMGPKPGSKYTIERIDNNGNYCKENCKWATMKQQMNNTRQNKIYLYNGSAKNVTQLAKEHGIKPGTLFARLRRGSTIEKAIEK